MTSCIFKDIYQRNHQFNTSFWFSAKSFSCKICRQFSPLGPMRTKFMSFHSQQKERTHINPTVTVFHSTITTYLSDFPSISSSDETDIIITRQYTQRTTKQTARNCLALRLTLEMVLVSNYLKSVRQRVTSTIDHIKITKKPTAQGECNGPVPFSSIVPIVIPQRTIEKRLILYSTLERGFVNFASRATLSTHLKSMKKINANIDEAMSMKYLKAMS